MQRTEFLGLESWQIGDPFLQCGQDFNPLDRIDPEIMIETHVEIQHLGGIPRFLRNNSQNDRCELALPGVC